MNGQRRKQVEKKEKIPRLKKKKKLPPCWGQVAVWWWPVLTLLLRCDPVSPSRCQQRGGEGAWG